MKAITPVIAIIVLLLITVAISGGAWTYISGYWTGMIDTQIEVTDAFCAGTDQAKILVKNIGTGNIKTGDIAVLDSRTGNDISGMVRWSVTEPKTGMVMRQTYDDGSGAAAADTSGLGNVGALLPAGSGPAWTTGKSGGALEFDGLTGYVNSTSGPSLDLTDSMSVTAWVNNKGNNTHGWTFSGRWDDIVTKWYCPGGYCYGSAWWFGIEPGGRIRFIIVNSTGSSTGTAGGTTMVKNDSSWHHVAGVYDGEYVSVYVDGNMEGRTPYTQGIHVNSSIPVRTAASGHTLPNSFNGTIDEVRIYNRSLNIDEIQALMNYKDALGPGETMTMSHTCAGSCSYKLVLSGRSRPVSVIC